jgi:anti-sigma B factor antagonist
MGEKGIPQGLWNPRLIRQFVKRPERSGLFFFVVHTFPSGGICQCRRLSWEAPPEFAIIPAMQISQNTVDGVTVLALEGRLDAAAAPEAQRAFSDVLEAGANRVLVDLTGVEYVSSGGIRAMVTLYKGLERIDGTVKLCGLSAFVADVFEITNLRAMFDICLTREAGLEAFREDAEQSTP